MNTVQALKQSQPRLHDARRFEHDEGHSSTASGHPLHPRRHRQGKAPTPTPQRYLFGSIDACMTSQRALIVTTNLMPAQLAVDSAPNRTARSHRFETDGLLPDAPCYRAAIVASQQRRATSEGRSRLPSRTARLRSRGAPTRGCRRFRVPPLVRPTHSDQRFHSTTACRVQAHRGRLARSSGRLGVTRT